VTISAHDGDGDNVINHAEAQGGVTLSGTVTGLAAGATFLITVTDGEFSKTYTATVNHAGTGWTATIPTADATALADGTLTVTAQVTDQFGNPSAPATQTFTVDTDQNEILTINLTGLTSGHAVEDQSIRASITDSDNDVPSSGITYTWEVSHDGGNTWSTVGGNAATYTPTEADEGGLLKVLVSFKDAAGNTESGTSTSVGVLPLLTIANDSLSVSPNGSVPLHISVAPEPSPDDTISVKISFHSNGASSPTITAGDHATGSPHTSGGITTYTFSMADVNSGLTFTNHGDQSDTLTVNEILNGNIVATSQTITVTDPPISGGSTIVSDPSVSPTSEHTVVQPTSAHDLIVSSPFTEALSANGDLSTSPFKPNVDHHAVVDPGLSLASVPRDQLLQHPADNLLYIPAHPDHGADPARPHVDVDQSPSFKFADDGNAHPGAVPSDPFTLTALPNDLSGTHGPAAPAHAPGEDTLAQSSSADNHVIVGSPFAETLSGNSDSSAFLFKTNLDHHITDPEINFAQNNANNLLHLPARPEDNGVHAVTDGAHPVHPHLT